MWRGLAFTRESSCPFLPQKELKNPIKLPHMVLTSAIPQMTSQPAYVLQFAGDNPLTSITTAIFIWENLNIRLPF